MSQNIKHTDPFSSGLPLSGIRKAVARLREKRASLAVAAAAAFISLTFVFFAVRARWAAEPKSLQPEVTEGLEDAQVTVVNERPLRLKPPEPESEPEPKVTTEDTVAVAPEVEVKRVEKPVEAVPVKVRPARPVTTYSPMGRPIARIFVNTRTNEPPAQVELKTGLDRTLNLIANAMPGMLPPPKFDLRTPGEDVLKSLDTDVVLLLDDESSLAKAGNVANLKQELKKHLAEGGNVEDFVGAYHRWLQLAYEVRQGGQSHMAGLLRKGDIEGARRFVEERNAVFAKEGIAPLSIPAVYPKTP